MAINAAISFQFMFIDDATSESMTIDLVRGPVGYAPDLYTSGMVLSSRFDYEPVDVASLSCTDGSNSFSVSAASLAHGVLTLSVPSDGNRVAGHHMHVSGYLLF